MNQTIHYVSACAGSGKTTTAMAAMAKGIALGERFVVAQPTRQLIESTLSNTRNQVALGSAKYVAITSDHFPGATHSAFTTAINDAQADIIFTTHATLLACWEIANKGKWNLIIDEIPAVDTPYQANLSLTWDYWTKHLVLDEADDADAYTVSLWETSRKQVEAWAYNEPGDDVIRVTQPFWQMAINPNIRLSMSKSDWQTAGYEGNYQLHAHGTLLPSILRGWKKTTIMGANFENSLLNMVWSAMGVDFQSDPSITVRNATHTARTGARATVHYFTEKPWSKYLRDKIGAARISEAMAKELNGRQHIWSTNNDIEDWQWKATNGTRLKPISHGLNNYVDFDCAVFLAALNETPGHGKWLQNTFGLDRTEVARAKALEAAYQMVMRTNLRVETGEKQVDIYVADRRTADYLCDLLPGSKQRFVQTDIFEIGQSQRGRPRLEATKSAANRMREDRERKKQLKANVAELSALLRHAQNVLRDVEISPMLTFSPSILVPDTLTEQYRTFDDIHELLTQMYEQRFKTKDENLLITGATFAPTKESETQRGLDAFLLTQILQFDFDDSELDPRLLTKLFSDVKHVAYNSFNNGRDNLYRYRVFIPLSHPVDKDTYELLWDTMAARVVEAGYAVGKNQKGKQSGLDASKRTPVSLMYAPCQAKEKKNSFWLDNWQSPVLDVLKMIERAPQETPDYVEVQAVDNRSDELKRLLTEINRSPERTDAQIKAQAEDKKQRAFDRALEEWSSCGHGEGNSGFFRFGAALQRAGYDLPQIEILLNRHYADSNSDANARRAQIKSIMSSLRRDTSTRKRF